MRNESKDQAALDFEEPQKKVLDEKLEDKPLNTDMQRVAATVLLRASLEYRDMFVPADVNQLKQEKTPVHSVAVGLGYPRNVSAKGLEKMHGDAVKNKIKSMEGLSDRLRKEIIAMSARMDKNGADWINQYGVYIARCMKQIIPAKNPEELYALMLMYNSGQLDFLFENSRAKAAEENKTPTNDETTPAIAE